MTTARSQLNRPDLALASQKGKVRVRPLRTADLAQVAALHETVFPNESGLGPADLQNYFADIFLHNPWVDETMPSLVAEENGQIVGFLGVLPRVMWVAKRKIRVAVHSQLMVQPSHRFTGAALALVNTAWSGPQELAFTDGSTESSRRLWEFAGGIAPPIYNLHWLRILRPAAFALSRMEKRPYLSGFARLGTALIRPVESLAARASFNPLRIHRTEGDETLQPEELAECVQKFSSRHTLRPEYDGPSMHWLLSLAAPQAPPSTLRIHCVRGSGGQIVGWYVYCLTPGDVSHVLQLGGARHSIGLVLDHLLNDAFVHGSVALSGRMEPEFASELWARRVLFLGYGAHFVCRSADREVLNALRSGDAFLSRLEGEWWMRFHERAARRGRR